MTTKKKPEYPLARSWVMNEDEVEARISYDCGDEVAIEFPNEGVVLFKDQLKFLLAELDKVS